MSLQGNTDNFLVSGMIQEKRRPGNPPQPGSFYIKVNDDFKLCILMPSVLIC